MAKNGITLDTFCGPKTRRYGFWTLIALLTALTFHDVYVLVDEYLENPRQVDMVVIFNDTITMPNITFCTHIKQFSAFFAMNESLVKTWDEDLAKALKKYKNKKDFLRKEWEYHMTAEAMMVAMALTSLEVEIDTRGVPANLHQLPRNPRLHGKNQMINDWLQRINDLDVSYAEFYQKTGHEMLKKGLNRMRRISPNENDVFRIGHKITWISQQNFCFQPTFDTDEPIQTQGPFLLMQTKLDLDKLAGTDLPCMTADFHGRPSDLIRHMDGPGSGKDGVADDLCPGQYIEVHAEVKAAFDMLPSDSPGRKCMDRQDGEKTDYECKMQCRIDYIRSLCGCTPVSLQYLVDDEVEMDKFPVCNYTKCTIDPKTIDLQAEPNCKEKCYRDCHQVRYTIGRSNAKKTLALTNQHKQMLGRDLITVSFTWGSFEYIGLEQDWKYTPVTFAAALGGAIGVYLGLSVLTVIVAVVYGCDMGYRYLTEYMEDKKRSKMRKDTETGTNGNSKTPVTENGKETPSE